MSLPHWIKWNKVKGKYVINNNMDCFEQNKRVKLLLTRKDSNYLLEILADHFVRLSESGANDKKQEKQLNNILDNLEKDIRK